MKYTVFYSADSDSVFLISSEELGYIGRIKPSFPDYCLGEL